jgi:hypothetical protein
MFTDPFALTEITLFYHDISSSGLKRKSYGTIEDWTSRVPVAKSSGRKSRSSVPAPSSTTAISTFRTTGSSSVVAVTMNNVAKAKKACKSSQPPRADEDVFEDESAEREAALSSPIKGPDRRGNVVGHISSSEVFLTVVFL